MSKFMYANVSYNSSRLLKLYLKLSLLVQDSLALNSIDCRYRVAPETCSDPHRTPSSEAGHQRKVV